MGYAKVQDKPGLVRDESTDQIINTNTHEYEQYITRHKKRFEQKEREKSVEEDLADLKSEMNEIKSLLKELVNGN